MNSLNLQSSNINLTVAEVPSSHQSSAQHLADRNQSRPSRNYIKLPFKEDVDLHHACDIFDAHNMYGPLQGCAVKPQSQPPTCNSQSDRDPANYYLPLGWKKIPLQICLLEQACKHTMANSADSPT